MENEIVDKVKELVSPFLRAEEIELVEIVYRRQKGSMVLRLLVDKQGGISLDECSALNRKIGEALDELILIDEPYILEVSSPGLDRPLKLPSDFKRAKGRWVKIVLNSEIEGKGVWIGEVVEADDKNVTVKAKDREIEIPLGKIVKAKKEIIF